MRTFNVLHPARWRATFFVSLALAAVTMPPSASAHGPQHGPARPVVKEQKPWGIAGDAKRVGRTIEIRMSDDMRFTPDRIDVRLGETVRLVAVNAGGVLHEIVIGTPDELRDHAETMKKHPGMEHDEPYVAHVDPGTNGDIVWTFNREGTFEFACLIPGHFDAGMKGRIMVAR